MQNSQVPSNGCGRKFWRDMHHFKLLAICLALEPGRHPPTQTFHIAPMQCYTNAPLRKLFHLLSPASIKWTEMEKVDDIFPKAMESTSPNNRRLLLDALEKRFGPSERYDESNLVLQLGSNDPHRLQSCIRNTLQYYSFEGININCGCPSIESGGAATYGASLMKDASLTGRLVESMRRGLESDCGTTTKANKASTSISVKCRIAVFDQTDDVHHPLRDDDYQFLKNYVSTVHDAGANQIILHARPAILSGISPVKNRIVPRLNYDFVEKIAADFPEMDVTLNGGIQSLSHLKTLQGRHQSVMAGRWCLRRPLDLIGVEALLGKDKGIESKLAERAVRQYVDYAVQMASSTKQQFTISDLCLPLFLIVEQLREDYDYDFDYDCGKDGENGYDSKSLPEEPFLSYDDIESLYRIIQDGVKQIESFSKNKRDKKKPKIKENTDSINLKRLSSSFKTLVGTKVANKWKRNRSEL